MAVLNEASLLTMNLQGKALGTGPWAQQQTATTASGIRFAALQNQMVLTELQKSSMQFGRGQDATCTQRFAR